MWEGWKRKKYAVSICQSIALPMAHQHHVYDQLQVKQLIMLVLCKAVSTDHSIWEIQPTVGWLRRELPLLQFPVCQTWIPFTDSSSKGCHPSLLPNCHPSNALFWISNTDAVVLLLLLLIFFQGFALFISRPKPKITTYMQVTK